MTQLTQRERVKVNAVLSCLRYQGHNIGDIAAQARSMMSIGHPAKAAYEKAINAFIANTPDVERQLQRIVEQVAKSDDGTVAKYDSALGQYLQTGNEAALASVEKMAVLDAVDLAHENGEISAEDALAGRIDWEAMGMDPDSTPAVFTAAAQEAMAGPAASAPEQPSGYAPGWAATGYSSARAREQERAASGAPRIGGPYEGMNREQMRAAMRGEPLPATPGPAAKAAPQAFAFNVGAVQTAMRRTAPDAGRSPTGGYSSARAREAELAARGGPAIGGPYQGMSATQMRAAMRGEDIPAE